MKSWKKAICLALALTLGLGVISCKKEKAPVVTEPEDPVTDTYLVRDGASDYTIVIPTDAGTDIQFAAGELQMFFREATGVELPIVTDEGRTFSESDKVLSIGDTTILRGSGVTVSAAELGTDGLRLVTQGDTVLMAGGSDTGAMYAAYEFLERTFNFECYASDEYYIDTEVTERFLKAFNVTEVPAFARRSVGLYSYTASRTFRNRMRQQLFDEGWIYWSHSHFKIMPVEEYYLDHPTWYSSDGVITDGVIEQEPTQLCLTNDEMRAEFTKNVIELMDANPDCGYIMLGQEDVRTFCECPTCAAEVAIYKESGVMMHFVNKVADDVQAHIDASDNPDRKFYLCTFGYHRTEKAPTNYNAETGEYTPIDDTVLPRDNVMIMVAPISTCYAHSLYDDCNVSNGSSEIVKSWKAVASGHLYFWIYNKFFSHYFIPYDNFGSVVDNYKILQELGAQFVYHQGNKETEAGGLQALNSYVQAKLMWNPDLNPTELVENFAVHYYKAASDAFLEYYNLLRMNYVLWEEKGFHAYPTGDGGGIFNANYWTRDYLDQLDACFDEMTSAIDRYRYTDADLYETLLQRINVERCTVWYLYLELYFDQFTYAELSDMIDNFSLTCAAQGISVWREKYLSTFADADVSQIVAGWRTDLLSVTV